MTVKAKNLLPLAVLIVAGCAHPGSMVNDVPSAGSCGQLVRWRLPKGPDLTVDHAPGDARTYDVLVTQARLNTIATVAESYCRATNGEYPQSFAEMMSPSSAIMSRMSGCSYVSRMNGCRFESSVLKDWWGRPIFYGVVDHKMVLTSAGPDGTFATDDDIGLPSASNPHAERYELTRP